MDNITVTTLALSQSYRNYYPLIAKYAGFARWCESLNPPEFRILYRVTGVDEFVANPNIQIQLRYSPCIVADRDTKFYAFFAQPFTLFARIDQVQPCNDDKWVSVEGVVTQYQSQKIIVSSPDNHNIALEEIIPRVALPDGIHAQCQEEDGGKTHCDIPSFNRFHLFFHPSTHTNQRYGIIDKMWNGYHQLELDTFPELELPEAPLPSATKQPYQFGGKIPNPNLPDLEGFLKSQTPFTFSWSGAFPPKR